MSNNDLRRSVSKQIMEEPFYKIIKNADEYPSEENVLNLAANDTPHLAQKIGRILEK